MKDSRQTAPPISDVLLALEVMRALGDDVSRQRFLDALLPEMLISIGADAGGLVSQHDGQWVVEGWTGPAPSAPGQRDGVDRLAIGEPSGLPESLISEAIDRDGLVESPPWWVSPLPVADGGVALPITPPPAALVFRLTDSDRHSSSTGQLSPAGISKSRRPAAAAGGADRERIGSVCQLLSLALRRVDVGHWLLRRVSQLSSVLQAAAEWQRLDEDEALLRKIADTATELLDCERASIFLWQKRRKKLIGRPALGIEGDVLEVEDDAGVVGEVLSSGEPRIWNGESDDEARVNRSVDRSLDFQTRSLVAVPMSGRRDELIGVFEAINHRGDGFDGFDAAILADLSTHAAVAIESQRQRKSLTESRDRLLDDAASSSRLIGDHPAIESVRQNAAKVAGTDLTVLVLGKNGTGKEVLARHVHYESGRRNGPFIAVNCAALVESLLESELFGHEKGAFTDANQTRVGKFELASGGTLFLDEVGDMSPGGQAKLLRVLEEKVVVRVGGSQVIPVDVRVIAATNQPLEELIAERRFREDLFFRLNVVSLTLPPLADRGDDVLLLAEHFLGHFAYEIGRPVPSLNESAKAALRSHGWPGNIRELRNTIERVCYLCADDAVGVDDLMLSGSAAQRLAPSVGATFPDSLTEATKQFQVAHLDAAIDACGGNMTDAATRLGLHRSNLYRKMRQLGMPTSGE